MTTSAYNAAYYVEHKEEIAAKRAAYYTEHKEERAAYQAAYQAAYRAAHKEEKAAKAAAYRAAHKEEKAAKAAAYYTEHKEEIGTKVAAYYAAHKEEIAAKAAAWTKENPEKVAAREARRRIRKAGNNAAMTAEDKADSLYLREKFRDQSEPCWYCGEYKPGKMTVDHILSVKRGGSDHWWNLTPACRSCNSSKNTKDVDEFLRQVGVPNGSSVVPHLL